MAGSKKTDNVSLSSKIAIRRWLLERMGITDVKLLDTCAGAGHVWKTMAEHVTVSQWIRCDIKPRQAGTLKMTALDAVKTLPLADFNVIDVDPYGEPFHPYREVLQRLTKPLAIFLTHGHVMQAQVSNENLKGVGIPLDWDIPRTPNLSAFVARRSLEATWKYAEILHSASITFPLVSYYALGVRPLTSVEKRK